MAAASGGDETQLDFDSVIIPNKKVDIVNYITEIIFQRRYTKLRRSIPKVEFWRKEFAESDLYREMAKDYVAELTQVRKILKVFSPEVVLTYVKNNDLWSLRYITKDKLPGVICDLFVAQIKYLQDLGIKAAEIERLTNKVEYVEGQAARKRNNIIAKGV